MKPSLVAGLSHEFRYQVTEDKTVPFVFADVPMFQQMPPVFATAYFVGLVEWVCMQLLAPHLDEGEQSVGTGIDVSHVAATPPGMSVVVQVTVESVDRRRIRFRVKARDAQDAIGEGSHERFVIDRDRFLARVAEKASGALES